MFILVAGWRLGRRTIETLTDTAPEGSAERISDIARRVGGVVAIERVRARSVGPTLFVDLVVAVSRTLPLDRVAAIKTAVDDAIRAEMPEAEVDVVTQPRALDDETVLERVMVIARNHALAVHHVTVHAIGGRLSISLDLEVDGSLSLGAARTRSPTGWRRRCAPSSAPRSRSRPISSRCRRAASPGAMRRASGSRRCATR